MVKAMVVEADLPCHLLWSGPGVGELIFLLSKAPALTMDQIVPLYLPLPEPEL